MWICPECNTNVNDENLSCEVCGAARKPLRYDSTLFSSLEEPVNSVLAALIAKNVLMLVGGLFFLTSDLMIRLLARPAKS